jgi:hypothetical protein
MLRGHIACQQGGQAVRPLRNKCRDRVAQRPCVRLRPLAYVTGNKTRGSIGSPPERGAQVHKIKARTRVSTGPLLRPRYPLSRDLVMGDPDLTRGGGDPDPIQGTRHATWESRTIFRGLGCAYRVPVFPRGGPVQLIAPWDISSFLVTWRPLSRPRGGVGCCSPCG